jgi:hypothetical protein
VPRAQLLLRLHRFDLLVVEFLCLGICHGIAHGLFEIHLAQRAALHIGHTRLKGWPRVEFGCLRRIRKHDVLDRVLKQQLALARLRHAAKFGANLGFSKLEVTLGNGFAIHFGEHFGVIGEGQTRGCNDDDARQAKAEGQRQAAQTSCAVVRLKACHVIVAFL